MIGCAKHVVPIYPSLSSAWAIKIPVPSSCLEEAGPALQGGLAFRTAPDDNERDASPPHTNDVKKLSLPIQQPDSCRQELQL